MHALPKCFRFMLSDCKANVINWFEKYIAPNVTPSAKGAGESVSQSETRYNKGRIALRSNDP